MIPRLPTVAAGPSSECNLPLLCTNSADCNCSRSTSRLFFLLAALSCISTDTRQSAPVLFHPLVILQIFIYFLRVRFSYRSTSRRAPCRMTLLPALSRFPLPHGCRCITIAIREIYLIVVPQLFTVPIDGEQLREAFFLKVLPMDGIIEMHDRICAKLRMRRLVGELFQSSLEILPLPKAPTTIELRLRLSDDPRISQSIRWLRFSICLV
jgi:hypothetical protein